MKLPIPWNRPKGKQRKKTDLSPLWCLLDAPNLGHILNLATFIGENVVPWGWRAPSVLNLPRSPLKGDIPNKCRLYEVYMGLMMKGTIPRVPPFSL